MELKSIYQPVDIMDFFEYPEVEKYSWGGYQFEISFPELHNGDLDVRLANGDKVLEYTTRNNLKQTLKAFTDLLPCTENCDPYFGLLRHRTRFEHRIEMDKYVYDLRTYKKENSTRMWLQILAMEAWGDTESIWYCDEDFKEYCAEVGSIEALKQQKIFSIEIEFHALLAVLYNASKKFILRKTFKAYMDEEGEGFPVSELTKIKKNITYC